MSFDLFCRVVDNFGDAGVCWRLARRLAALGQSVRLWIDRPEVLARLLPALDAQAAVQTLDGVQISAWDRAGQARPPRGGVVIEAFACALPPAFEAAMAGRDCLWINLEYLSAEPWVEGCHGLPSPQTNGVPKFFFFPGFTPATGGLLREPDLLARHEAAQAQDRGERLRALTGRADALPPADDDALTVLLFCYPDAPLAGLQAALAGLERPVRLLSPGDRPPAALRDRGGLRIVSIPFVPQARFDELLGCCDLNFVRGEDSLVRALWAGSPLVWQIYRQAKDAHLDKLEAWLDRARWPAPAAELIRAWNRLDDAAVARALPAALAEPAWSDWRARSRTWCAELADRPDLGQDLLDFCLRNRPHGAPSVRMYS
ncbi:elongation factor P maturation arginine rhamnosyltransferase EarP [Castellaniella sp.]|uniref:elongation factor P maturation arginine rhamnosyltransferase EarP n=1 Tax=Castellaniella sp. TaxID=1955812 RepID=UPI003C742B26